MRVYTHPYWESEFSYPDSGGKGTVTFPRATVLGQPANGAGLAIVTMAQRPGIAPDIGFMSCNTERTEHRGDRSRIKVDGAVAASSPESNDKCDLDIINAHADELNEEAIDVLGYQVQTWIR